MFAVVAMLRGEADVDTETISKPDVITGGGGYVCGGGRCKAGAAAGPRAGTRVGGAVARLEQA
jgi:hypothetical protein